ncbi:hypothetical protein JCM6882_004439 [Rhodosporidiobolus microsporus]
MLQLRVEDHELFPIDLFKRPCPVLVTFSLADVSSLVAINESGVDHLQLHHTCPWRTADRSDPWFNLDFFDLFIRRRKPVLASLSLPYSLHPSAALADTTRSTRDRLLECCASRNIQVIWRLDAHEPADDLGVSREFWSYAKELKAKKRQGVEAEASRGQAQ